MDKEILYPFAEKIIPYFHSVGLTPNHITSIGIILRCIGLYYFYHRKHIGYVVILFIIAWILDACDGLMARTYNQATSFGSLIDHISDAVYTILILFIVFTRYNYKKELILLLILLFILIIVQFKVKYMNKTYSKLENILYNYLPNIKINIPLIDFGLLNFLFIILIWRIGNQSK